MSRASSGTAIKTKTNQAIGYAADSAKTVPGSRIAIVDLIKASDNVASSDDVRDVSADARPLGTSSSRIDQGQTDQFAAASRTTGASGGRDEDRATGGPYANRHVAPSAELIDVSDIDGEGGERQPVIVSSGTFASFLDPFNYLATYASFGHVSGSGRVAASPERASFDRGVVSEVTSVTAAVDPVAGLAPVPAAPVVESATQGWVIGAARDGAAETPLSQGLVNRSLKFGGVVTGTLAGGNVGDTFVLDLKAGEQASLSLTGTGFEGAFEVHGVDGSLITAKAGNGSTTASFVAAADQIYYVVVSGLAKNGGFYNLFTGRGELPSIPSPVAENPPAPTLPPVEEPVPTVPVPADPAPVAPAPAPAEPLPVVPAPAVPSPSEPGASDPLPIDPAPVDPTPIPVPAVPMPAEPVPVEPAPVIPAPSAPLPADPAPEVPAPAVPMPAEPAPTTPAPVLPAPAEPEPAAPAPAAPTPAQPEPRPVQPTPEPPIVPEIPGKTIVVHNAAEMMAVLGKVESNTTVYAASGDYGTIYLNGVAASGVTVTSLDADRPAVFTDLKINNSKGLTFSGLEIYAPPGGKSFAIGVYGSESIEFRSLYVHGTLDGVASGDQSGITIRNSKNVTVANSEFQQLRVAVEHQNSDGLTVTGNFVHEMESDGIVGGGSSYITIANNVFTNFQHTTHGHPDAIQVYTTGIDVVAHDIMIANNVVMRGEGTMIQGVWVRDEKTTLPYENLTITGNVMVGLMGNGIGVYGAGSVAVTDNIVVGRTDQISTIMLRDVRSAVIKGNQAEDYWFTRVGATASDNILLQAISPETSNMLGRDLLLELGSDRLLDDVRGDVLAATDRLAYFSDPEAGAARLAFAETVITGTDGADNLRARDLGDFRLVGGDGNDLFAGNAAGTTTMIGGAGDDNYIVRTVRDIVVEAADEGRDSVTSYIDYTLPDFVENLTMKVGSTGIGNELDNRIIGSAQDDLIYGLGGNDNITAGAGNDVVWGGAGADAIRGEAGDDKLYGEAGDDRLYGDAGDDLLDGGAGNDLLEGGAGNDILTGGSGADTFVFRTADFAGGFGQSQDVITDFSRADGDHISLMAVDAKSATSAMDRFTFIGNEAFHATAGELRWAQENGGVTVFGDTDGDGRADFSIHLANIASISASDIWM